MALKVAYALNDSESSAQITETQTYITDLLGELQGIARVSGLDDLSNDLKIVLARHLPK